MPDRFRVKEWEKEREREIERGNESECASASADALALQLGWDVRCCMWQQVKREKQQHHSFPFQLVPYHSIPLMQSEAKGREGKGIKLLVISFEVVAYKWVYNILRHTF